PTERGDDDPGALVAVSGLDCANRNLRRASVSGRLGHGCLSTRSTDDVPSWSRSQLDGSLQGEAIGIAIPGHAVRPANEGDLDACNRLCIKVHGHDRGQTLMDAIRLATATVVEHVGRITGYATMMPVLEHAVAESNEDL